MIASVSVVPANEASWADLQTVFGSRGDPHRCQCQRYKMQPGESWASVGTGELVLRLRGQTDSGHSGSGPTAGLIAAQEKVSLKPLSFMQAPKGFWRSIQRLPERADKPQPRPK